MTVTAMADPANNVSRRDWRTIGYAAAAIVALLGVPATFGILKAHAEKSGGEFPLVLALAITMGLLGIVAVLARALHRMHPLPTAAGERASAIKRRRFWYILGAMFASGFVIGIGGSALQMGGPSQWLSGALPPWFAVTAAVVTAVALIAGTLFFYRQVDELERADNLYAAAVATNALTIVYPLWFLLWKGGFLAEPQHEALFAILFVVMMTVYGWRKLRR